MSEEEIGNTSNTLNELDLEEVEDASDSLNDKHTNPFAADIEANDGFGQSPPPPPSEYVGAECPSPSDTEKQLDIPLPIEEKGVDIPIANTNEMWMMLADEKLPCLQKASSVPQIHLGSPRRKKTSEASPLPDPVLLGNLEQENYILRENILKLKAKNEEIIAINHDWDKSYSLLFQQNTELQKQFQKNNEQLNNEITKKEEETNRIKAKLERFINEGSLDENTLLAEEREEKNKVLKREQVALQTAKEFQQKCQHLDHILRQTNQQKVHLERELQCLSLCVENQQQCNSFPAVNDCLSPNHLNLNNDVNEMELLRQQLQTYVEDFDAEKNDKQRLVQENEEIKRKLVSKLDENEHLKTQLEIYEKDFSREREKRIQLMRKSNAMSRTVMPPAFSNNSTKSQQNTRRQMQEYNNLIAEKEHIVDRLNNLENQGVNSWNVGGVGFNGDNSISNRLPPYPHSRAYMQTNQSLTRSAPPYTYPTPDSNVDRSTRDRGILGGAIPEQNDSGVNNTSSSWSYFGT